MVQRVPRRVDQLELAAAERDPCAVRRLEEAPGKPLTIGPRKNGDGVVVIYDNGITQDYLWKM